MADRIPHGLGILTLGVPIQLRIGEAFGPIQDFIRDAMLQPSNRFGLGAHDGLYQLTGVDLVAIPGLHASTVQTMIAEIGLDLGKWPTEKAFCACLGLAPRHDISGGKVLRRSTLKTHSRAGQALRLAAQAAGRSQSGLGAFYRRIAAPSVPNQPLSPRLTRSHVTSITCSPIAPRFAT